MTSGSFSRSRPVCMMTRPAPVSAATRGDCRIALQAPDIVDDMRAGGDRQPRRLFAVGVDRDQAVAPRRERLDDRQDARLFLGGGDRHRRPAASIRRRHRRSRRPRPACARPAPARGRARRKRPPSEKLSGVTLSTPITMRLAAKVEVAAMRQGPSSVVIGSAGFRTGGAMRAGAAKINDFRSSVTRLRIDGIDFRCAGAPSVASLANEALSMKRILFAALPGRPDRTARGSREPVEDLQLFFGRRQHAGAAREELERARPAGQEHRPAPSRRDADGVHHQAQLPRTRRLLPHRQGHRDGQGQGDPAAMAPARQGRRRTCG